MGVLGGTFDPIHLGHLGAAEAAIECADLDEVVFVPTGKPPHRPRAVASDAQRLEMCRLATADEPRFAVSDIELVREGPSYTLDTLVAIRVANPHAELFLVLGWDAASQFRTWHQPAEVLALAVVIVVSRPGRPVPTEVELAAAGIDRGRAILCARQTPAVSASEIRRAVAGGRSIADWVPPAVERYIVRHRLYGDNQAVG